MCNSRRAFFFLLPYRSCRATRVVVKSEFTRVVAACRGAGRHLCQLGICSLWPHCVPFLSESAADRHTHTPFDGGQPLCHVYKAFPSFFPFLLNFVFLRSLHFLLSFSGDERRQSNKSLSSFLFPLCLSVDHRSPSAGVRELLFFALCPVDASVAQYFFPSLSSSPTATWKRGRDATFTSH